MIIKNGKLFTEDAEFAMQDIAFSGEKIDAVGENLCGEDIFDATDCYVIRGLLISIFTALPAVTFAITVKKT